MNRYFESVFGTSTTTLEEFDNGSPELKLKFILQSLYEFRAVIETKYSQDCPWCIELDRIIQKVTLRALNNKYNIPSISIETLYTQMKVVLREMYYDASSSNDDLTIVKPSLETIERYRRVYNGLKVRLNLPD
jgi:hypothetical protein